MNRKELEARLQKEDLLNVYIKGTPCKYVSEEQARQDGPQDNITHAYGIYKDGDAYHVFFTENERRAASSAAGYRSEEEACDKLYEGLLKQVGAHREDVIKYLKKHLCEDMGLKGSQADDICTGFQRNFDIAEEFWKVLVHDKSFAPGSGISVRGYSASELSADYVLSTTDAYRFLVGLREEPWTALARLNDEHPEATRASFRSIHAFKEKLRKEGLLSIYINGRPCRYVDEEQIMPGGEWHNLTDVYGIYQAHDDENAHYVFFTDYERGIATYSSRQKSIEDACKKLYRNLLRDLEIHQKEVLSCLNYDFSKFFLIEDIEHYKERADEACGNLKRHFDIAEELWITLDCKGFPLPGYHVTVRGYSAEELHDHYRLNVLGAYNYLVFLREDPMRALGLLKKGLPRK
ncbi:MAG: hypothetical protein II932_03335 [Treponema sp.]|nr:hypothetical protein [Treponema sp.]